MRIVVFDVEGVLLPTKRTIITEIVQFLSWTRIFGLLILSALYQLKIIPVNSFIRKSYKLLRGLYMKTFFDMYRSLPISRNSKYVFTKLRESGVTTVLLSSGLPQEILDDLKQILGADQAYGVLVDIDKNGALTGEVGGDVIEYNGKLKILKRIIEKLGTSPLDVAVVADDWNNLQMLKDCGLFIGFNPETEVAAKAMIRVEGDDLLPVLKVLQGQQLASKIFGKEVFMRKALHVAGVSILIFLTFFGLFKTQLVIIIVLILYLSSEYLRSSGRSLPFFTLTTRLASTELERTSIVTTPIWYASGILLTITLFPPKYAFIGVLTLSLGDPVASLVGLLIKNKHFYSFNKAKSLEGTLAGFSVALLASSLFIDPFIAMIGCSAGMLVEALPSPLNDNVTIPISSSLIIFLLDKILMIM